MIEKNDLCRQTSDYGRLLATIRPLIERINNPTDAELCLLWLAKLDEATPSERALRNKLLADLTQNVQGKRLQPPFSTEPPPGPLSTLQGSRTGFERPSPRISVHYKRKMNLSSRLSNPSMTTSGRDGSLRTLNENMANYNAVADNVQSSFQDVLPPPWEASIPPTVGTRPPFEGRNILIQNRTIPKVPNSLGRVYTLENERGRLFCRCNELESLLQRERRTVLEYEQKFQRASQKIQDLSKKLQNYQMLHSQIMGQFRTLLREIVNKKNQIIADLECQLRNSSIDSTSMICDLQKLMEERCTKLELEYKNLLGEAAKQYTEHRLRDKEKINSLMDEKFQGTDFVAN